MRKDLSAWKQSNLMESLRQKRQAKERGKKEAHLRPKKSCSKDKAFYRITLIDQPKGSETDIKCFKAKSKVIPRYF